MLNLSMYFISTVISGFINILIIIFFILIGGILPLFERKFLSLTQRRVGPKYVGYKGRLQFIADSLKVLLKEYTVLTDANNFLFFFTPILFFNVNLIIWLNIVWVGNIFLMDVEYTLIYFILISSLSHSIIFITGLLSKNTYTLISSTRVANMSFISELLIVLFITVLVVLTNSFNIIIYNTNYCFIGVVLPIIPTIILIFLVDNGKTPFDVVEAETEIIMGYHVEYGGFLFGLYVLCEYLHIFFFSFLMIAIFIIKM